VKKIGFLSFGHWSPSAHSKTRSAADFLHQSIDLAVAAEELGVDGAYFRVHHFAQQAASPFPLLSAIGARTSKIEIGTGVIDMRYENPLYMAEDAGAADLISGGRLQLGISRLEGLGTGRGDRLLVGPGWVGNRGDARAGEELLGLGRRCNAARSSSARRVPDVADDRLGPRSVACRSRLGVACDGYDHVPVLHQHPRYGAAHEAGCSCQQNTHLDRFPAQRFSCSGQVTWPDRPSIPVRAEIFLPASRGQRPANLADDAGKPAMKGLGTSARPRRCRSVAPSGALPLSGTAIMRR
jgi:hypothetical protein